MTHPRLSLAVLLMAGLLVLALAAVACGESATPVPPTQPPTATPAPTAPPATEAPPEAPTAMAEEPTEAMTAEEDPLMEYAAMMAGGPGAIYVGDIDQLVGPAPMTPAGEPDADLGDSAQAVQIGEDRLSRFGDFAVETLNGRIVNARSNEGQGVFVGLHIPLDAVEERLREGHRRKRGPQLFADGQCGVELPFGSRGYQDAVEPTIEAGIFENAASEIERVLLAPVVDAPTTGDIVAIQVVIAISFQEEIDVALIVFPGVVSVLVGLPAIEIKERLGHVPFPHNRTQRLKIDGRSRCSVRIEEPTLQVGLEFQWQEGEKDEKPNGFIHRANFPSR